MNEPNHTSVKVQSSAVVLAALITTGGAITAACIQTGLISKPPVTAVASTQMPTARETMATFASPAPATPAPTRQVSFLGTIEPIKETTFFSPPSAMTRDPQVTPASAPVLLPTEGSRQMASPWVALKAQAGTDPYAQPPKTAQKSSAWDSVTRFFGQR